MREALRAFQRSDEAFFAAHAARTPGAPRALAFLAQASLVPGAMALASRLAERLPQEATWDAGHCPICGSLPFHSVLAGKQGVRHLVCSFCRASYRTMRLKCPYCLEQGAAKLPYYTSDEAPGYRVDACLSCTSYIKTTDFRVFDRRPACPCWTIWNPWPWTSWPAGPDSSGQRCRPWGSRGDWGEIDRTMPDNPPRSGVGCPAGCAREGFTSGGGVRGGGPRSPSWCGRRSPRRLRR